MIAALDACSDCLLKYGGHELAAGLSVTRGNVAELRKRLNDFVRDFPKETWEREVVADCELKADEIQMAFAEQLLFLEPFGNANPMPLFYLESAKIVKSYSISGGKHLKLLLEKDGVTLNAVMFGASYECFNLSVGELVDIMFQVDINEYNNVKSVQLIVREMRANAAYLETLEKSAKRYEEVMAGATFDKDEYLIPTREDFKQLYLFFRRMEVTKQSQIPERQLLMILYAENKKINLAKLRIMMDILGEMKLCEIERGSGNLVGVRVNHRAEKVNLENSKILERIISQCIF